MPQPRYGLPVLYLAIFLLALTGLFAKLIPLNAVSIIQLRAVVAAGALLLFGLAQKRGFRLGSVQTYAGVYLLGLFLGVHWVTFFHAMQLSTVAVGMLALFSYPMITILLEPLFSKRHLQRKDIIAGVIVFAGLAIMVGQDLANLQGAVFQSVLWGVFSALLFAVRNLFQKYHFQQVSSDALMFHQVVAVAVLLVLFIDYPQISAISSVDWLKLVLLGLLSTAAAHTLWAFSLKQLPAKSISLISCLQPPIAALLAWWVIGETPGVTVLIGGGIVLLVAAYESLQKA